MRRLVTAHILLIVFGVHALVGGTGGVAVVCFGGGHEHSPSEAEHCESACGHGSAWPIPSPMDSHDDDCGCTDVELEVSKLSTLPRVDHTAPNNLTIASAPHWGVVFIGAGLGRRGPPKTPPPWFDPAGEQRIEQLSTTRLII